MEVILKLETNDIVEMKKQHPCGSKDWKVIKTGAEIKLACLGCGHEIEIKRSVLQKSVKKIKRA